MNAIKHNPNQALSPFSVCLAATLSLAIAMGIGRFAFTPLFPFMVRDGLLGADAGAWLAASNYLGYLVGALVASKIPLKPVSLLGLSLIGIVLTTAAVGLSNSLAFWNALRFLAGVLSAWGLVATSSWALGWLANAGRGHLAGVVYAGVGLGIIIAGIFCLIAARPDISATNMWLELAVVAAGLALIPLAITRWEHHTPLFKVPSPPPVETLAPTPVPPRSKIRGLIIAYGLFGIGYILPATYIPIQARQLMDDPQIFGWAWPFFGLAAALSTLLASQILKRVNRLSLWAVSHLLMAVGVLLPTLWSNMVSIILSALLVGGTFMVITMAGMQEARSRMPDNPTAILGRIVSAFACGQLAGPLLLLALTQITHDPSSALNYALQLAALGLLLSGIWLWKQVNSPSCP